jgi:hypothetical protein
VSTDPLADLLREAAGRTADHDIRDWLERLVEDGEAAELPASGPQPA